MEQRFKEQKNDLMNIFRREKSDMEEGFIKEKEDIRRKFEVEFRRMNSTTEVEIRVGNTRLRARHLCFEISKRTAGKALFLRNANIEIKIRPREA